MSNSISYSSSKIAAAFLAFTGVVWLATSIVVSGWIATLSVGATTLLFALPGFPIALAIDRYGGQLGKLGPLLGVLCGIVLSSVVNACVVAIIGWNAKASVAAILLTTFTLHLIGRLRPSKRNFNWFRAQTPDAVALSVALIILFALLVIPLLTVGQRVGNVHKYYTLFAHDYLMRGTYSVSLLQGLPPRNIYLASHLAPNYYLFYSILAFAINLGGQSVKPDSFVASADLVFAGLFVIAFFTAARLLLKHRLTALVLTMASLLTYSYHGLYVLIKYVAIPAIPALQKKLGSSALLSFGDVSHSWYRDFLLEPHAIFALTLLVALIAIRAAQKEAGTTLPLDACRGLMLAGAFAADAFVGLLGAAWLAIVEASDLMNSQDKRVRLRSSLSALFGFALCMAVFLRTGLASFGTQGSHLLLKPYATGLKYGVALFPLDLGPSLFMAALGWLAWRKMDTTFRPPARMRDLVWLLALAFVFAITVQHSDREHVNLVYRKSLKVMQIPLFLLSGLAFRQLLTERQRFRSRLAGTLVLWLPALTALAADISALSGLHDTGQTSTVTDGEVKACDWLRTNTPLGSIVQSIPELPDQYFALSPVAMLGGRAMALGNIKLAGLSCRTPEELASVETDIDQLFRTADDEETLRIIRKYEIDFIYLGPAEKKYGGTALEKYKRGVYTNVYSRDGVDILKVSPPNGRAAH